MGNFANKPEPTAPDLTPVPRDQPWHGQSGFRALGRQVPWFRRAAADQHLKAMGFTCAEQRWSIVCALAGRVASDDPHMALEECMRLGVDVTGCYRLLAVILSAPPPPVTAPPAPAEATYLDLVGATVS